MRTLLVVLTTIVVSTVFSAPALAAGSPWLAEPDTGSFSVSYVRQSADEKWTGAGGGDQKGPMPGGELTQGTLWLTGEYTFRDNLALDAQVGWARSELARHNDKGLADATLGLTWRVMDELIGQPLSVALRGGVIVAGGYDTGTALPAPPGAPDGIYAIGDGGNGVEASVIAGKVFGERVGVSLEIGMRNRNNDIPNNMFYNLTGLVRVNERVTLAVDYNRITSDGDLDIGGPGFSADRFPEVAEEATVIGGRVAVALTEDASATLYYGNTTDGRNTSASRIFGMALSYAFSSF